MADEIKISRSFTLSIHGYNQTNYPNIKKIIEESLVEAPQISGTGESGLYLNGDVVYLQPWELKVLVDKIVKIDKNCEISADYDFTVSNEVDEEEEEDYEEEDVEEDVFENEEEDFDEI